VRPLSALLPGMELPCGGKGRCLKCRVRVTGAVSEPSAREKALLTPDELAAGIRYACMAYALGDVTVTPLSAPAHGDVILTEGIARAIRPDPWGRAHGLAIDIGTTTVAAYLHRLKDGALLATAVRRNPQATFGADVTSRLDRAMAGEGGSLAKTIRNCVTELLLNVCAQAKLPPQIVDCAVLTGNTSMLYLLTERPPASIALAPFEADCLFGQFVPSETVGLPHWIKAYLPRCISAYVGADINTALLAAGYDRPMEAPRLLLDIGTNGEMVLAVGERLLCCATAAGPAFEGAGISRGMPARDGAIHRVWVENGAPAYAVLGDATAQGLCGSGLLDLIAVLLDLGILDETGRLAIDPYTLPGTAISLTQADVRAVQLAKAAIAAGVDALLHAAGLTPADVAAVDIAGGFGSHLSPRSAARIGLIPPELSDKARAIGNAAGAGAGLLLQSRALLKESESLPACADVIPLAIDPYFMEQFVERMGFDGA
jgi:uncharacterized 2Fe-2S/4Fe-4S cluster protein (DUF4445 family)